MVEKLPPYDTCDVCRQHGDYCICRSCPKCGSYGDPQCYANNRHLGGSIYARGYAAYFRGVMRDEASRLYSLRGFDLIHARRIQWTRGWDHANEGKPLDDSNESQIDAAIAKSSQEGETK